MKKKANKKIAIQTASSNLQLNPFSIDSYRKYKKQKKSSKHPFVSVSMQMPVFSQYTHLQLKKNHSRYNRINRTIIQNSSSKIINLNKIGEKLNKFIDTSNKNAKLDPHSISFINKKQNRLSKSVSSEERNKQKFKNQMQNHQEGKWNKQIQKYMSIKQEISGFNKKQEKFPLMKLNRCNQIKRKLMFGSHLGQEKPSFIYDLETQDPEQLSMSKIKVTLPNLQKSFSKAKNISLRNSTKRNHRNKSQSKMQNNKSSRSLEQFQDEQINNISQSLPKASNQTQKILVNFISQYFKHKLKTSRKKRYNYQRTWTQIENPLQINISQLKKN